MSKTPSGASFHCHVIAFSVYPSAFCFHKTVLPSSPVKAEVELAYVHAKGRAHTGTRAAGVTVAAVTLLPPVSSRDSSEPEKLLWAVTAGPAGPDEPAHGRDRPEC